MLLRQARLRDDTGAEEIAWIDARHASPGRRVDFVTGDGGRSPIATVVEAWSITREKADIAERQDNQRQFGGSIR